MDAPRALLLCLLLAGCVGAATLPDEAPPAGETGPSFADVVAFDGVIASEPDVVALPDGTLLVCGMGRRGEEQPYLWRVPPGGAPEALAHPNAPGRIDCAWGVDAAGRAYYATSAGDSITVATSADGAAWDTTVALGIGVFDRPWVEGGAAGRALVTAYDTRAGIVAWSTADGGATWEGPFPAQPEGALAFQVFSEPAWLGSESFIFLFGVLAQDGGAVVARDLWAARTDDGGRTWRHELLAAGRGNLNNVLPSLAPDGQGGALAAWTESGPEGRAVTSYAARTSDGTTWEAPVALHNPELTTLMARALPGPGAPAVAMYAAEGALRPSFDAAPWSVRLAHWGETGWSLVPVADGVHEGTIATGGYGSIAAHLVGNPGRLGSGNSQELLHHLGAARTPAGRPVVAWADDAAGPVGLRLTAG